MVALTLPKLAVLLFCELQSPHLQNERIIISNLERETDYTLYILAPCKTWLCHQAIRALYFICSLVYFIRVGGIMHECASALAWRIHVNARDQGQVFASLGLCLLSAHSLETLEVFTEPGAYQFSSYAPGICHSLASYCM